MILTWKLDIDGKEYASKIDILMPKKYEDVSTITSTIERQIKLSIQRIIFGRDDIAKDIEEANKRLDERIK